MEGLILGKKGTSVEKFVYSNSIVNLLTLEEGVEIIHQTIEKDKLFYLYPYDDQEGFEFYYILSGEIQCELEGQKPQILGPNDYFIAKNIKEPILFTVKTDLTLLIIYTKPTFGILKKTLSDLRKVVTEVEKKDRYTSNHSDRVSKYAVKIAHKLKLNARQLWNLDIAGSLHDIGKINVPEEILKKPGKLTDEEYEIIKRHPVDGAKMLMKTNFEEIADIIIQHHERLDGTGYPYGLKGDEISIEARIISVCDTFDAMTEDRTYRKAFSAEYAIKEIKSLIDTHYDRDVVYALEEILKEEGYI